MKITKKKKILPVAAKPKAAEVEVLPSLGDIEEPDYTKPQERIAFHLALAQEHGRIALAHLICAGWELYLQKQAIGYGGWNDWCEKNLNCTRLTADRYVAFFCKMIAPLREASGTPLSAPLKKEELEQATIGMEQKSATRAMIDLEIIKRPKNWGGKREDAGRKKKVESKEVKAALDAVAQNEALLWAAAKSALDTLVQLDADRDFLRRLSDDHLATVVSILGDLSDKAAQVFQTRLSTPAAGMLPNREGNTAIATPEPRPSVGTGDV